MDSNVGHICLVCKSKSPSYTCPKCNARYCSAECYKKHSNQCVEVFARDSAIEALQATVATEDEKQRMLEILQRLQEAELGDETDSDESDESDEQVDEEQLLQELAATVIKPWEPWWMTTEASQLELSATGTRLVGPVIIEELPFNDDQPPPLPPAADSESTESALLPLPPVKPLPLLSSLTTSPPSPVLRYHLLDILYAYCFVMRLFNGDYTSDPLEAAEIIFTLSAVLGGVVNTTTTAINQESVLVESVIRTCQQTTASWAVPKQFAVGVMTDVGRLLQLGRSVIITALMDLTRLCSLVESDLRNIHLLEEDTRATAPLEKKQNKGLKPLLKQLKSAERKLLYFMCWANEEIPEVFSSLALLVETQFQEQKRHVGMPG